MDQDNFGPFDGEDKVITTGNLPIMLTLCPVCRKYIQAIEEGGKTNPLPAPHPRYHPCRSPETPEEQTVWNYMSIGRMLQFEQSGFWSPVEASLYELCPPRKRSLSGEQDPSQPSTPPSKHSIADIPISQIKSLAGAVRFAPQPYRPDRNRR